jgi:hypothetical protein
LGYEANSVAKMQKESMEWDQAKASPFFFYFQGEGCFRIGREEP